MRDYVEEAKKKAKITLYLVIVAAVVLILLGLSNLIGFIVNIATWLITSFLTTAVVQVIIQAFSGDFFEKIPITISIGEYDFKVSLFVIITIILKLIIFV